MDITNKFWQLCHHLRHDGVDSSDYIEQLTYLLFLKMAKEKGLSVPENCDWGSLKEEKDENLVNLLDKVLSTLKEEEGLLGAIFQEPVSRIKKAESLRKMITLLDEIEWSKIDQDVIGIAFEELIGRVANDGKKGAGQYFTPRPLIQTIVNVLKPNPFVKEDFKICDVACGSAGFLVTACEWIKEHHTSEIEHNKVKFETKVFYGQELVKRPHRLALMNLFLHGVDGSSTIRFGDTIEGEQTNDLYDIVITNPPFGNNGASIPKKRDFVIKTSNKQLNFIQHVIGKLKIGGQAAIVLPDSCLTDEKAKELWQYYLEEKGEINLHTILRLPRGIFAAYAGGVKACVIFLEKGSKNTSTWLYDARTNVPNITKKTRQLNIDFFKAFEKCFIERVENEHFRCFSFQDIKENAFSLDFKWLQDDVLLDSDNLPPPRDLIEGAIENLESVIDKLRDIFDLLSDKK